MTLMCVYWRNTIVANGIKNVLFVIFFKEIMMIEENMNEIENNEQRDKSDEPEVKWEPVSNIDKAAEHDPYEYAPKEVKEFHKHYVEFWLKDKKGR